ncbi:MAG: phenylalanine--tRNA ligase subunit alpha [Candidatus Micrarchaeota archaeon]
MMYKGEDKVLDFIVKKKKVALEEAAQATGQNPDAVRRMVESLRSKGYVSMESEEAVRGLPTEELVRYGEGGFPEFRVYRKARSGAEIAGLSPEEKSIGVRWARVKGLIAIEGGKLVQAKSAEDAGREEKRLNAEYRSLRTKGACDPVVLEEFFERKLVAKKVERKTTVSYTGKKIDQSDFAETFDVNVPGPDAPLGKSHPVSRMISRISSIMTELGFEEMEGSIVESSFWNFDALFQPQDHPARELADTFYLEKAMPLPDDKAMVERVKKAHEQGWKYRWDPKEASKAVLRTHTTCLSARYLAGMEKGRPRKFFAIGRVFRNEATDYKHLAEFHQVEGIIAWDGAKFTDLLGVLKEFYRKLGFEKIRFRPSFFPYTEPSLEIEVFFEKRKQWMELGGAGVFRPEVSLPLAGVYPVLAWGLSLERPLMLLLEREDIRDFYRNDLGFLNSARLE